MKLSRLTLVLVAAGLLGSVAGCGRAKITPLQRKEAANLASEAEFARTLRDYTREEGLLAKAAEKCPDDGNYWLALGQSRMRLKQRATAKAAYQRALAAYKDEARLKPGDPRPFVQQVLVLALLGRGRDAHAVLEELPRMFPGNRYVQGYIEGKRFERMQADPAFRDLAL